MSLVNDHTSEWRKRPINLLKVISSFVSQLTVGDDLTRVSLPTVMSLREMLCFSVLFEINKYPDDPLQRFLCVGRWLISCLQNEQMEKKPFNSVIGEQHVCWIEHDENNWTEYLSEQVSHHPPISAFFVRNQKEKIQLHSNLQFSVSFGGNHASILSSGKLFIETAFESYKMNKVAPDMNILNVVWGTKYFMWEGSIQLECPTTGYTLEVTATEQDPSTNTLTGTIKKGDEVVYYLGGTCGHKTDMWKPGDEENKVEYFNFDTFKHPDISYPAPDCQVAFDSLKLWKPVAEPIIKDDMWEADLAKKKIEQEQREREKKRHAEEREFDAVYFVCNDQEDGTKHWVYNDKETLNKDFLEKLRKQVAVEEAEAKKKEEEKQKEIERLRQEAIDRGEDPDQSQEGCSIS